MLIRFDVGNFRSILEPVSLTTIPVEMPNDFEFADSEQGGLLTRIGIYGANASGKSNVLSALHWLLDAIKTSLQAWNKVIPIEPFALHANQNTTFKLEVLLDEIEYIYYLELNRKQVVREWLKSNTLAGENIIFDRIHDKLDVTEDDDPLIVLTELFPQTALSIAVLDRLGFKPIGAFVEGLQQIQFVNFDDGNFLRTPGLRYIRELFFADDGQERVDDALLEVEQQTTIRDMLFLADLGIDDLKIIEQKVPLRDGSERKLKRRNIRLTHSGTDETFTLPFNAESKGTRAWFNIIGTVAPALKDGTIVVVDELDASLHPLLSREIIRMFANPQANPNGAQLIFSAHDITLLSELRPDEIWFTAKRADGSTKLEPLTEFDPEQLKDVVGDLGSAYLRGEFGGIPRVGSVAFDQADN